MSISFRYETHSGERRIAWRHRPFAALALHEQSAKTQPLRLEAGAAVGAQQYLAWIAVE